jgi:molybdate transport system substrate-binding protein
MLFCGAGLQPAAEELIAVFSANESAHVTADYAGSEVLLSKLKLTQTGDLFMPGEDYYVELAAQAGLVHHRRRVCSLIPTIFVQKGNPHRIASVKDLLAPGIRLGLGDPRASAIGRLCKVIFANHDLNWEEVEGKAAYLAPTVNGLAMQIQAQSLDAVIVWDATARQFARYGDAVPITPDRNAVATVELAVLASTRNERLAMEFLTFVAGPSGQKILQKHGYTVVLPRHY